MRRSILPIRIISLVLAAVLLFQNAPLTVPSFAAELSDQEPTTDQPLTSEEEATLDEEETPEEEQIPEGEQTLTPEEQAAKTAFLEGIEKLRELLANETLKEDRVAFAQQLEEQLASLWQQLYGEPLYPEEENPDGVHEPTPMEAMLEPQEFGEIDALLHNARDTLNAAKKDLENGNPGEPEEKTEEEPAEEPEENSQGEVFHVVTVQEYLARLDALDAKMEDGSYKEDQEGFEKEFYALVELYCGEDEDVREALMEEMLMLALEQGMNPADLMMVLSGSEETEVPEEAAEPETGEETTAPEETEETEQTDSPETNGETTAPEANDETAAPEETEETVTPENAVTPAAETDPAAAPAPAAETDPAVTPAPAAETDAEAAPGEEAETDPAAIPAPMAEEDAEETPVQPAISGQLTDEEDEHVKQVLLKALVLLVRLKTQPMKIFAPVQRGSGSAQLNKDDNDYRFYTEYMTTSGATTAGIQRQTIVQVYLQAGEFAYFGSSVDNSQMDESHRANTGSDRARTGKDIVVEFPTQTTIKVNDAERSGRVFTFDVVKNGQGYVGNYIQERNGPLFPDEEPNSSYYQPLSFQATEEGTYTFHFHSEKGNNSGGVCSARKVTASFSGGRSEQGYGTVAAWDVTVVGDATGENTNSYTHEVKSGRAWCNYLALDNCSAASKAKATLDVHILTKDGYIYKAKLKDITPFGFLFFSNNLGFTTNGETKYSLYHSFFDDDNNLNNIEDQEYVTLHRPSNSDTTTAWTNKIFFNKPSEETQSYLQMNANTQEATISNVRFIGFKSGISEYGHGGYFEFTAHNATTVSLEIDFREMMKKMKAEAQKTSPSIPMTDAVKALWLQYNGTGIVSLNGAVKDGENKFGWDGTDTSGQPIPPGNYYDAYTKIQIHYQAKAGEIHFPMVDVEGLYGGVEIERLTETITGTQTGTVYDICYNNSPLATDTIEGNEALAEYDGNYALLSDETRSVKRTIVTYNNTTNYFPYGARTISTLQLDGNEEEGLASTSHHVPVNSHETTMRFNGNDSNGGGGNQAGVDIWTYYVKKDSYVELTTDFAVLHNPSTGMITGRIFYDNPEPNGQFNEQTDLDRPLAGIPVQLMKEVTNSDGTKTAAPMRHTVSMPVFDNNGFFVIDPHTGLAKTEEQLVTFETTTDATGTYKFTGVPFETGGTKYSVQVMLDRGHKEILNYECSTSKKLYPNISPTEQDSYIGTAKNIGKDGNLMVQSNGTWVYEKLVDGFVPMDYDNMQWVRLSNDHKTTENGVEIAHAKFADIGYTSVVPAANQKDYTVVKTWNGQTPPVDDITIRLWYWDPAVAQHDDLAFGVNGRSGLLLDTVKLSAANGWKFTWNNLDKTKPYFFTEFYDKFAEDGSPMTYDTGEQRKVLIGSTMPIFDTKPTDAQYVRQTDSGSTVYVFQHNDVSLSGATYEGHTRADIPVQYFSENSGTGSTKIHPDASWEVEKVTNVDTNAMLFDVTYTLESTQSANIIHLDNAQTYSETNYYVWLNHEVELPNFISKKDHNVNPATNKHNVYPVAMEICTHEDGKSHPKGVTITGLDSNTGNFRGDSTDHFLWDANDSSHTSVKFVPDDSIYHTGTGTRTYKVEYTVDTNNGNKPVHVYVIPEGEENAGELAYDDAGGNRKLVTSNSDYHTYSWTMSIHVYDVQPDGTIYYNPSLVNVPVDIQQGMGEYETLEYVKNADGSYSVKNEVRDPEYSLVTNDILRVPLFKNATQHLMGTCADITGFALTDTIQTMPDHPDQLDMNWVQTELIAQNQFHDTNVVGINGGSYQIEGTYGDVNVTMNIHRQVTDGKVVKLTRGQDHANYLSVSYTPKATAQIPQAVYLVYQVGIFADDISFAGDYNLLMANEGTMLYSYVKLEPETVDIQFAAASMSLGEDMDLNFYVTGANLTEQDLIDQKYYVRFYDSEYLIEDQYYVQGTNLTLLNQTFQLGEETVTRNLYAFSYANRLTAYQMTHPITAELYFKDPNSHHEVMLDRRTYSIQRYANNMLAQGNTSSITYLQAMLVDMLNYGAATQKYAHAQSWILNEGIPANEYLAAGKDRYKTLSPQETDANPTNNPSVFISAQLILEEGMRNSLKIRFKLPDGQSLDDVKIRVVSDINSHLLPPGHYEKDADGNVFLKREDITILPGGTSYLLLDGIAPFFWDKDITLEFVPVGGQIGADSNPRLTYSVAKYCRDVNAGEELLSDVVKSMLLYSNTAAGWYSKESDWRQKTGGGNSNE